MDLAILVGQILDSQYQIEALLGQGGMGAVYKARHVKLGDIVAIKVMPPHISKNLEHQRRFLREGQAARRFKHPNAVTVYDLRETSDGMIYMVLEYIEGHNLREEINKKGCFSPKEALELIEGVARALNEAHKLGVVHRDIKPENIMVSRGESKPIVKLLDLGIAKISGATALTVEGQVLGTPYYMSPEQWGITSEAETAGQKPIEIDGRADIYSLGVILYEMVTGQKPFMGNTIQELAVKHITTTPIAAKELNIDLPVAFSRAIAYAIAKERENRPSTCHELIDLLNKGLTDPSELSDSKSNTLPISEMTDSLQRKESIDTTPMAARSILLVSVEPIEQQTNPNLLITKKIMEPLLDNTKPMPIVADNSSKDDTKPIAIEDKKSKKLVVSIIIIGGLVLSGLGLYNWQQRSNLKPIINTDNPTPVKVGDKTVLPVKPVEEKQEIIRYWVEVFTKGKSLRKIKDITLSKGENIQFHFKSKQTGYLYILMPGKDNKLTAILTTKPMAATGVTTNLLKENTEYIFPKGNNGIEIRKPIARSKISVIFSTTPLKSVPFLDSLASNSLTEEEQKAFLQLSDKAIKPNITEIIGNEPYALVNINEKFNENKYLTFDIDIKPR